ncbi:cell adhesion molecule 2-like [Patella vulgata]|uniref:cell adhesion molecule 2-like n=1 Tax=Patella vulgata TaxID=6465 RepID=UPI00217F23DE|nr:cell adhesion molecule 2-like [Patella vulgata]
MNKVITFVTARTSSATLITLAPANASAAVGTDAILGCMVSNKGTDKVKWRKAGDTETLTADAVSVKSNRYKVSGANNNYNLTITSITVQDEALPTNISAYWSTLPIPGTTANLTCRATYGRPPPRLTWFKDEIPYNVYAYTSSNVNAMGYGDAVSTLPIPLANTDEGKRFRCQADYDGWTRAVDFTITTHLTCKFHLK